MKSVPQVVKDAIRTSNNLYARPNLTVEWSLNRYNTVIADNIPDEDNNGYNVEMFPIESIYGANRPTKGILKARVGEAIVASNDPLKQNIRFYAASDTDIYKYWCSPVETDGSGNFPKHSDGVTMVRPFISYARVNQANKIVIKIENSWATPRTHYVKIQTSVGGGWTTVSTNPTVDAKTGQITLYYNSCP